MVGRRSVAALAGVLALAGAGSVHAGPSVTMMADSCAVCHGTDGRSTGEIDSLAGISTRELVEEMNEMAADPHEGRLMGIVAKGFSLQEIQALGQYFQKLGSAKKTKGRAESGRD